MTKISRRESFGLLAGGCLAGGLPNVGSKPPIANALAAAGPYKSAAPVRYGEDCGVGNPFLSELYRFRRDVEQHIGATLDEALFLPDSRRLAMHCPQFALPMRQQWPGHADLPQKRWHAGGPVGLSKDLRGHVDPPEIGLIGLAYGAGGGNDSMPAFCFETLLNAEAPAWWSRNNNKIPDWAEPTPFERIVTPRIVLDLDDVTPMFVGIVLWVSVLSIVDYVKLQISASTTAFTKRYGPNTEYFTYVGYDKPRVWLSHDAYIADFFTSVKFVGRVTTRVSQKR